MKKEKSGINLTLLSIILQYVTVFISIYYIDYIFAIIIPLPFLLIASIILRKYEGFNKGIIFITAFYLCFIAFLYLKQNHEILVMKPLVWQIIAASILSVLLALVGNFTMKGFQDISIKCKQKLFFKFGTINGLVIACEVSFLCFMASVCIMCYRFNMWTLPDLKGEMMRNHISESTPLILSAGSTVFILLIMQIKLIINLIATKKSISKIIAYIQERRKNG